MTEYFYHVFMEDEDDNIETDYGYFHSFFRAFQRCADLNKELGIDSGDCFKAHSDVREWGTVYCGSFTIVRCEFED